jgi:hypothetical protein
MNRRHWFKTALGGAVVLAVGKWPKVVVPPAGIKTSAVSAIHVLDSSGFSKGDLIAIGDSDKIIGVALTDGDANGLIQVQIGRPQ